MREILCVKLDNDMDLILAHKKAMKLCDLLGFSLIAQTSIATGVSEIARCAIEFGKNAELVLGVEITSTKKSIKAIVRDSKDFSARCADAIRYARKLIDDVRIVKGAYAFQISLQHPINFRGILNETKLELFANYFKNEPPLSPYDEIRRKNLLLQELADQLKVSENDYRLLTDSLPLMMFSVAGKGAITYTNKWLQKFLGNIPKELSNASWKTFFFPADYAGYTKDLNNALLRQTPFSGQYRLKETASGNFLWHFFSIIPLKNEEGVIERWIGFIVDIHAQKVVEQTLKDNKTLKQIQAQLIENQAELEQKVKELNRSNYELEQFAHLASHDLQEPLRKLFFYSDVLKRNYSSVVDERGRAMLDTMAGAAGRMKELISDLLNYSQLQNQNLQIEAVNINSILNDIVKDFDLVIKEKKAVIHFNDFPVIQGNAIRLRQLFSNLISNSLKYSKENIQPFIEVMSETNGAHVTIRVKDNGIGFDEKYKDKIFGLFERLHTRDQISGTGIGLSICKKIVELHGGNISATSVAGEYSIFEVNLPHDTNSVAL